MKESKMMVSRCLLLNVLKATRAPSILQKFVDSDGWHLMNVWLAEYKKTQNIAVMVEMVEVLQKLPVTVHALKKGTMGKLVKQLSKHEHPEIKSNASELLGAWMALFGKSKGTSSESREGGANESSRPQEHGKVGPSKSKKKKEMPRKEEKPPIEATPPGPLVALGQPRQHTMKRPRDIALGHGSTKLLTSPPASDDKGSPLTSPATKTKGPTESLGFMNALSSQVQPQRVRKVRKVIRAIPNTKLARQSRLSSEDDAEQKHQMDESSNSGPSGAGQKDEANEDEDGEDGPPKPKKKKVSWAPDDQLTDVLYFEPDESERVNRGSGNFLDAAAREKLLERQTMEAAKRSNDRMEEQIPVSSTKHSTLCLRL
jgi:protein phosphatase 1 regulatory subunit 10